MNAAGNGEPITNIVGNASLNWVLYPCGMNGKAVQTEIGMWALCNRKSEHREGSGKTINFMGGRLSIAEC